MAVLGLWKSRRIKTSLYLRLCELQCIFEVKNSVWNYFTFYAWFLASWATLMFNYIYSYQQVYVLIYTFMSLYRSWGLHWRRCTNFIFFKSCMRFIVASQSFAFVISLPDYRHLLPIWKWFCDLQLHVANTTSVDREIRYLMVVCIV